MTHDELLKKINWWKGAYVNRNNCKRCIKYLNTLRAVVELHYEHIGGAEKSIYCYNCQMKYPCPTIQAIEKELK